MGERALVPECIAAQPRAADDADRRSVGESAQRRDRADADAQIGRAGDDRRQRLAAVAQGPHREALLAEEALPFSELGQRQEERTATGDRHRQRVVRARPRGAHGRDQQACGRSRGAAATPA
jgi:hypothetical protein